MKEVSKDYLRDIQKFVTSQYWNSGLRITAGVMVPLFVLVEFSWLSVGIPFLWGALFVSLTDTPGPVHQRRNGMLGAIVLNSVAVLLTGWTRDYQWLLVTQIIVGGFFLSMLAIYGARAGAVGVLALIVMLLNLLSVDTASTNHYLDSALVFGGGAWYMALSLLLYRLKPYRLVEQALGEHLIEIANYVRSRASLYKSSTDIHDSFTRIMEAQSAVQRIQDQTQELLFNTRRFVADPSPKSRSCMRIFLDSVDLFEETMFSYQDYKKLREKLGHAVLLDKYYGIILQLAAELEYVGILVQSGNPIKKTIDLSKSLVSLKEELNKHFDQGDFDNETKSVLSKTLANIRSIQQRINDIILYTQLDTEKLKENFTGAVAQDVVSQPLTFNAFIENLTLSSDNFRHAIRLTVAMIVAYVCSLTLDLSHPYWVLLTIVTIMKPLYSATKKRNIERVMGTLVGVVIVFALLYLIDDNYVLVVVMILSMLLGYSLLRVNYFGFVVFLTMFVIISFHFLNPVQVKNLLVERIVDTVIGSFIAFLASRFVLPVWGHEGIKDSMVKMLRAIENYFKHAVDALNSGEKETIEYEKARQEASVALTNLSDHFQQILNEPNPATDLKPIHQFIIASHMLTGHIAALWTEQHQKSNVSSSDVNSMANSIASELANARLILEGQIPRENQQGGQELTADRNHQVGQLALIHALASDIRRISGGKKQ